jgi:lipopolysaccharide transport system permease protein
MKNNIRENYIFLTHMEYTIESDKKFSFNFKEIWDYHELFYFFTWRDIKVKYKQTFLGVVWALLQPFVMMVVFSVFFGRVLKVPSDNIPYPLFVYSGLMFWNLFSSGVSHAAESMVGNANIIKKIYFPRLIIPLSSILVSVFDFMMTLVIYAGLLIYYHQPVNIALLLANFLMALLITLFTTFGLGTLLSALNVKYRDFRYIIPFMIQSLLFLTPVIYPVSIVKNEYLRILLSLNPMAGAISLARSSLTGIMPEMTSIAISVAASLVLFITGLAVFRKTESYFADIA